MPATRTFGAAFLQTPHRSLWRWRLEARARGLPLDRYLVTQANLRHFMGAWEATPTGLAFDNELTLEDIVVGLCAPQAEADFRVVKLIVRILQSGRIDPGHLAWLARKERAHFVLYWILDLIPDSERNEATAAIAARFPDTPRGWRDPGLLYDPQRLVRRPWSPRNRPTTPRP